MCASGSVGYNLKKVKHLYLHVKLLCIFAERDLTNAHTDHLYCILKINKLNTLPVDKAIALHYKQRLGNIWDSIGLKSLIIL